VAPKQKPGRSKQDYCTSPEFLKALKHRLGIENFHLDVAASEENSVGLRWFTEEHDALRPEVSWKDGWAFCNPPFGHIEPWVKKAWEEAQRGAWIAMLLPAGVGANWWRDYVDGKAHVLLLNGRLVFTGETTPYPKDCVLLLYTPYIRGGYEVWNWRKECESELLAQKELSSQSLAKSEPDLLLQISSDLWKLGV